MSVSDRTFDRRGFLGGMGVLVVAIGAPGLVRVSGAGAATDVFPIGPALIDPTQIDSWIAIGADGSVTMKTGKVELGQGTLTSTLQLVADELDVDFSKLHWVEGDTWITPDQGTTSGSQSTGTENGPAGVRQAAAEARLALLNMASAKLGAPVSSLTVSNGVVSVVGNPSQSVSYAALIGGHTFGIAETGKAVPKPYTAYKVVGTSVPRVDLPAKVFGTFTYAQDIRVPGMVHARVVRPPTLDSKLVSVDGFRGPKPPGLIKVFVKNNYVAVVAETEWAAIQAKDMLKVTWQTAPLPSFSSYNTDITTQTPAAVQVIQDSSFGGGPNVDSAIAARPGTISETYVYPIQMHGSMGTSAATAAVEGNTATVWSSTQAIYPLRATLATALNLPAQNIHCIYTEGSGCYGLNKADDVALDAAVLSQDVGRPVRVAYMRADEHAWENYGQAYTVTIAAATDAASGKAKLSAWRRDAWTSTRGNRPPPPANMASGILLGFPETPLATGTTTTPSEPLNSVDGSNAAPAYIVPAARLTNHTVSRTFLSGPLRSPSRIQNTFANESMMDELAHAAGVDPVNFRLDNLTDPRLITVIQTAAKMSGWVYGPAAANVGKGRMVTGTGISAVHYEGTLGYNAAVVQVTVDRKTGKVTVDHVWSAQDCGPAINPDGMKAQAEGCVMQGISRTLIEEVRWGKNSILSRDWFSYPVIRFKSMPLFDFQIVNRPDQAAVGAGEVLITNMPAAIANAIFDATGKRLRELPFTPARVKAELAV